MSRRSPYEDEVAQQLATEGWTVFNTNYGFPDLFCIKDGKIKIVECKNGDALQPHQAETIKKLQQEGLDVSVNRSGIHNLVYLPKHLYDKIVILGEKPHRYVNQAVAEALAQTGDQ